VERLNIKEIAQGKELLAGATSGTVLFSKMILELKAVDEPQPLYLDFTGVQATASFLRESALALKGYCRNTQSNLYPVVANANNETLDDLELAARQKGDAIIVCTLDTNDSVGNVRVLGILEEKQKFTLDAVRELKTADAIELSDRYEAEKIGATGWNNRLSNLSMKGLLIEEKKGRGKTYRFVLEGF